MTARLKPHPYAEIVPKMSEAEMADLTASITKIGQLFPGITLDGKLLDGRSREEACHRAGVPFDTITWEAWLDLNDNIKRVPPPSPLEIVLALNVKGRRHLTKDQRANAAAKAIEVFEAEARQRMSQGGKKKGAQSVRTLSAPEAPEISAANFAAVAGAEAAAEKGKKKAPLRATEVAAKAAGVSPRLVQLAKEVKEKRPDLSELVDAAKMSLGKAKKAIKKEQADRHVAEYRPPVGTYSVIVTDVAWEYDDKLDGSDEARGGVDYATQKLDEIKKMKIPAAADCALWFWTTNAFLVDGSAAEVIKAWGFKPIVPLTWRKIDKTGKDRLGSGHYLRNNTEHCVLAVRGKPVIDGADQPTFFEAPRGTRHSEKPDEFFRIAEKVTPCRPEARLELNAIEEREGWVTSGSEQQAAARAKRHDAAARERATNAAEAAPAAPYDPRRSGVIAWRAVKKGLVVAEGESFDHRWQIERVKAVKLAKKNGPPKYLWRRWPKKGHTGRTTSLPDIYGSETEARAGAERRLAEDLAQEAVSAEAKTAYIDRLFERGWEPSPNGYAKKIDGLFWFIEPVNGSSGWQAYRPKQGEVRARNAEDFETPDAAMEWVEQVAPGAAELPAPPVDDGTLCGIRPSKSGDGCIHKQGHPGLHSNGSSTWRTRKQLIDARGEAGA